MLSAKIAIIAGSNGKTTVKEMVASVLRTSGLAYGFNPENQNTKIALATALLRLPLETRLAVFEVGARQTGDFQIPLEMLKPDVVALLNIGSAHVGEFGSLENLKAEKLSILDAPTAEFLVVPEADESICAYAARKRRKIEKFLLNQNEFSYQAPASEANFAAAQAVCKCLGLSKQVIQKGLSQFSGVQRRFEIFQLGNIHLVDDAFNSSPESARAGLVEIATRYASKKILLIIGSMLELGAESQIAHLKLGDFLHEHPVLKNANVITIGDDARNIGVKLTQAWSHFDTVDAAHSTIEGRISSYDVVYLKASRSLGFERLVRRLRC